MPSALSKTYSRLRWNWAELPPFIRVNAILTGKIVSVKPLSTDRHCLLFPLPRSTYIHDPTIFIKSQMVSFVALNAMQTQMIIAIGMGQNREFFRLLRRPKPTPRTITEIQHAIVMGHAIEQRLG